LFEEIKREREREREREGLQKKALALHHDFPNKERSLQEEEEEEEEEAVQRTSQAERRNRQS
jgi:hypothetical protein